MVPIPTYQEIKMESDLGYMSRTIYAEAAGQSNEGKVAVGEVIRNRANDETQPSSENNYNAQFSGVSTYKDVVTQPGHFESVTNDVSRFADPLSVTGGNGQNQRNVAETNAFNASIGAAIKVDRQNTNTTQGATYFFSPYIETPSWAKTMTEITVEGVRSNDFKFYIY